MPTQTNPLLILSLLPMLATADNLPVDADFALNIERLASDGITLGEEAAGDRLVESAVELEIALEYRFSDQWFAFATATWINELEKLESAGERQQSSALERDEIGLSYLFGDAYDARFTLGRVEFSHPGNRWIWWDESLDSISLKLATGDVDALIALAEEQARASTADHSIDPELADIRRLLLSLSWEIAARQVLTLYYLDQVDHSDQPAPESMVRSNRIDESDADQRWSGLSYRGDFRNAHLGVLSLELHHAVVSGREYLFEFEDAEDGLAEVAERERYRVDGSASGLFVSWRPGFLPAWSIGLGSVIGSGDGNPEDLRDDAFRQTGLQGDGEVFGELLRPELSNLEIVITSLEWRLNETSRLQLNHYRYRQHRATDEVRDSVLEIDPSGNSRDLGVETDLVITLESDDAGEWLIKLAEFRAGDAFVGQARDTATFVGIEFDLEF